MTNRFGFVAVITLVGGIAADLVAQPPQANAIASWQIAKPVRPSSDPVVRSADSLAALGDSLGALALLESEVRTRPKNAAAWHQLGVLQWSLAAAGRRGGFIADKFVIDRLRGADNALRMATKLAADSAQYWITLSHFNRQSDVASMHFAASRQAQNAYTAATKRGDSLFIAMAADDMGMAIWRRYEMVVNRALAVDNRTIQLQTNASWRRGLAKDFIASFARRIVPPTGDADHAAALDLFRKAVTVDPVNLRYSRHLYMALAEQKRWSELLSLATARAARSAFDVQARLAAGLALQRLNRTVDAQRQFDLALTMLDPHEADRLFAVSRLIPPSANVLTGERTADSATFVNLTVEQRVIFDRLYWQLGDPLIGTPENEHRVEFYARVVQAEFRWTDEDLNLRGGDTDRGDVFIRFGPPDEEITVPGKSSVQQNVDTNYVSQPVISSRDDAGVTLIWQYRSGDVFFFDMSPGFGTARVPVTDIQYVHDVKTVRPAAWDNVGVANRVDSMDVRITRFRARGDSLDLVVAANVSTETLLRDVEISNPEVSLDFRVIDARARTVASTSTRAALSADSITRSVTRTWMERVGGSANVVRVEATQRDVGRALRATLRTQDVDHRGFGISDILLASVPSQQPPATATEWRQLGLEPSSGVYRAGDKIGLAWEVYELAQSANTNRYQLAITVERIRRRGVAGLSLRLLDRLGSVLRQGESGSESLQLAFERTAPARATQVEYLALDWQGNARGDYRVRLEVTDLLSKLTRTRDTNISIR